MSARPLIFILAIFGLSGGLCGAETILPLRINCGGPAIDGWIADERFAEGGSPFRFNGEKAPPKEGAAPIGVYDTVRHKNHQYRIPLQNGRYRVRIHFLDEFENAGRAMDYRINGIQVIAGLSPHKVAGAKNRAFVLEAVVDAKNGQGLEIVCDEGAGKDVFQAGIEVLAGNDLALTQWPVNPGAAERAQKDRANQMAKASQSSKALTQFAGGPIKLVWLRSHRSEHYTKADSRVRLLGLDSQSGEEIDLLGGAVGAWSKPVFTPDGSGVVYTDMQSMEVWSVSFSGGAPRSLGVGHASDVWRDPADGVDWVYLRTKDKKSIVRRKLHQPDHEEPVWNRTGNGHDGVPWIQLSADGHRYSDAFPWSACGVASLQGGRGGAGADWKKYGSGCWPGLSPDNSYRFFHFNGNHVELTMFEKEGNQKRKLTLGPVLDLGMKKVYFPRWSNHPRYLTITGPENDATANLYLGKFNSDWSGIDGWIKVTQSTGADLFGDAWLSTGIQPSRAAPAPPPTNTNTGSPTPVADSGNSVFEWISLAEKNEIGSEESGFAQCSGRFRGSAVPHRHLGMDLRRGWVEADEDSAKRVVEKVRATGEFTLEMVVESALANQKGPARIMTSSNGSSNRNFTLGQEGGSLVLRLRTTSTDKNGTSGEVVLAPLQASRPVHLIVSWKSGELKTWMDGQPVHSSSNLDGLLSNWEPMPLLFGDEKDGGRDWQGQLSGIRIRSTSSTEAEVAKAYQKASVALQARSPAAKRSKVEARLVETPRIPALREIQPYHRALIENVYEVQRTLDGPAIEGRIVVTQWVILDDRVLDRRFEKGKSYPLVLEPWSDHPELEGENRTAEHAEFDASLFHEAELPRAN